MADQTNTVESAAPEVAAAGSAEAAAAAAPATAGADLVQADTYDFVPGAELFIRGRAAVCVRLDYPHVYWQWLSDLNERGEEAMEKHRSCSATPALFTVRADKKQTADTAHGGHNGCRHDGEEMADTSDEEDEDAEAEAHMRRLQLEEASSQEPASSDHQQQQQHQHSDASAHDSVAPVVAAATPAASDSPAAGSVGARASLMSMFSRRPDKSIFSGLSDAPEETVHASAPQSVSIEKCVRTRFCIPSKISQLTVLNCEDVEIEFLGVISSVELIRCVRCVLKCMQSCATYTLDDSDSCTIQFPGRQERVMVVSTHSSGRTVLLAQPGQAALPPVSDDSEEKEPADISTEIRYVIEPDAEVRVEESGAPTPSEPLRAVNSGESDSKQPEDLGEEHHRVPGASFTPAATKQYKTTWTNGAFSTHTLVRQGPLGYFNATS